MSPLGYAFYYGSCKHDHYFSRERFKCCKSKWRKEHKLSFINIGSTSTDNTNKSRSKERHTYPIRGDNNIYENLQRDGATNDNPYGEVSNKNEARKRSLGNEINTYEMIQGEGVFNKDQYGNVATGVSDFGVNDDNVNLYQRIQAECETAGHKNLTFTNTIEEATSAVKVSDASGNMYEKLQKPFATEHLYGKAMVDGASALIQETIGDTSYENVSI